MIFHIISDILELTQQFTKWILFRRKKTLTLFYFRFKMSMEGNTDLLDNEEAMLQPSIPELEARIQLL